MNIGNYELKNLDKLFSTSDKMNVPFFQRPYSWGKTEYMQFFEDLKRVFDNNIESYFIGTFFFKAQDKENIKIIDGQQRISTATILTALIRDILFEIGDENTVNTIETKYLQQRGLKIKDFYYRLYLSDINLQFFQNYIQCKNKPEDKIDNIKKENTVNDSNKLIFECYKNYFNSLSRLIKNKNSREKSDFLIDFLETLLYKFQVLCITVADEIEAFTIFETLNDRGLDLTIADLLKNYLFSILHTRIDDNDLRILVNQWDTMVESLGRNITSFFKHYWNSKYKPIAEKEIYRVLKYKIKNKTEVLQFLDEIIKESKIYSNFLTPEHSFWNNREIEDSFEEISILGIRQCFPVLLAAKIYFTDQEFIKVLKSCIGLSFRYSTVCNLHNNKLEGHYSDIANKIRNGEIKGSKEVRSILKELNPENNIYNDSFKNLTFKNSKIPKYILTSINDKLDTGHEITSTKVVTLEHIIPEVPSKEWESYFIKNKINHKDVVNKLFNMTILGEEYNRTASSKAFKEKKSIIEKSKLPINEKLTNTQNWNLDEMKEWSDYLLEQSKLVWKI